MTIIAALAGAIPASAKPVSAAEIEKRIATAEPALRDLEDRYSYAVLDSLHGETDAQRIVSGLKVEIEAARENIANLRAAHAAAKEREAAAKREMLLALRKSQVAAICKHLDLADGAAAKLSKALEEAGPHWRTLQEHIEKARKACPVDLPWPDDAHNLEVSLHALILIEFYRTSAGPRGLDGKEFPGSREFDLQSNRRAPADMESLGTAIKTGTALIRAQFKGKAG